MKTENAYNIDVVKYLSGLLSEAPINFDDMESEPDTLDSDDYRPGFKQDNMINQLGKVIDSDDASKEVDAMKVKKFSPKTNVQTDDGDTVEVTASEAKALKKMMDMLSSARMGEEQSAREKFLGTIQKTVGLQSMLDFAKSKGLVEEETRTLPQVDLGEIRDDYAVEGDLEEGKMSDIIIDAQQMSKEEFDAHYKGAWDYNEILADYPVEEANNPDAGEYTYTLELNGESQGYTTHTLTITSSEGESKVVADDFTYFEVEGDELQAQLHSWFTMGHGVGDEGLGEVEVEEGKLPAGLQAYQDKKNGKKADADKDEDKEVDEDKDEDKEEVDEAILDNAILQLKKLAGI